MLMKFILIYLLTGMVIDLISRVKHWDITTVDKVKTFTDVISYIIGYILVIAIWPILIIIGMIVGVDDE